MIDFKREIYDNFLGHTVYREKSALNCKLGLDQDSFLNFLIFLSEKRLKRKIRHRTFTRLGENSDEGGISA